MSNQVAMPFGQAITFDKAFVVDRLNECLSLLDFQVQRCLDGFPSNADLCAKALESFQNFSRYAEPAHGFTLDERRELFDRYFDLKDALKDLKNADQPTVRQADDSAAQPVAPTQLPMFGVLGKETKFKSFFALNEQAPSPASIPEHCFWPLFSIGWRPSLTVTKRILSHTRPVGGLA